MTPIRSIEDLYAHALAIEREAADRYHEFQGWFEDHGEDILAGLCGSIGQMEEGHYRALADGSRHLTLPALSADDHHWLESGSPEAAARDLFYRVAKPRHLLEIALEGERNALAFFRSIEHDAGDPKVRLVAAEMAREEELHVMWVRNALEYHVATQATDWSQLIAAGRGPGAFVGAEESA